MVVIAFNYNVFFYLLPLWLPSGPSGGRGSGAKFNTHPKLRYICYTTMAGAEGTARSASTANGPGRSLTPTRPLPLLPSLVS